jgi:hypothetical protein
MEEKRLRFVEYGWISDSHSLLTSSSFSYRSLFSALDCHLSHFPTILLSDFSLSALLSVIASRDTHT